MPMVEKPENFCRAGLSSLWDKLQAYVEFIESMAAYGEEDCLDVPMPDGDEIEDQACRAMCAILTLAPVSRCIIPLSADSFMEVDCDT